LALAPLQVMVVQILCKFSPAQCLLEPIDRTVP